MPSPVSQPISQGRDTFTEIGNNATEKQVIPSSESFKAAPFYFSNNWVYALSLRDRIKN